MGKVDEESRGDKLGDAVAGGRRQEPGWRWRGIGAAPARGVPGEESAETRAVESLISRRSPQALAVWGFALAIAVGFFSLMLPPSHLPGRVDPLDALFTATSAVCVTGLVVVDTARDSRCLGRS